MKIIYKSANDAVNFDINRYHKSLNRYGEVSMEAIEKALSELHYDPMHYSVLIEEGVKLLPDEESARRYYEEHKGNTRGFDRLRRVTGYLVGTLSRWNDGKRAEERDRLKHSIGQYSVEEKINRELKKREELNEYQDEYRKGTCSE